MTDKRQRDEYELVGMVDAIRCQRDGEELPNNRPTGPKWRARKALSRLNLNGAEHDVMECLVDRANKDSGLCYPSETFICGWTNRPLRTVQRAIDSLKRKRLISVLYRGSISSRYYINWRRVFAAARQMEAFEKRHAASRLPKVADQSVKSGGSIPARSGGQTMEVEPWKENHGHEMAHPPSAADALLSDISTQEVQESENTPITFNLPGEPMGPRGLQGEPVVSPPTSPTASINNAKFWRGRLDSSLVELKTCNDPERREQLEATVQRARSYLGCA